MTPNRPIVAVLVGSLRRDSINRKLARALERIAGDRAQFRQVAIGDLPLYNQDFDGAYPERCQQFKREIESAQAVLFVSPEANRSIPGVLKNAIDIASRPWGTNSFAGKPGAVIGASTGAVGTALMQQHLRNVCVFLDVHLMAQPEAFIRYSDGLIADDDSVTDPGTSEFLGRFVDAYLAWVQRLRA